MAVRDRKAALGNSLKAEEEAVRSRFERAETLLTRNDVSTAAGVTEPPPATVGAASLPPSPTSKEQEDDSRVKRDSFTMPVADYELIATLQKRCLKAQARASKSEILRAGLTILSALSEEELATVIEKLPKVKTGRPPVNGV